MGSITWKILSKLLLRFLAKSSHYYGTIILKYHNGEIANIKAEDSFDLNSLNSLSYSIEMLKKQGAGDVKGENSGKILNSFEIAKIADGIKLEEKDLKLPQNNLEKEKENGNPSPKEL